ncbi:MAG: response regulator transcription factor [Chloroflexi bacterium]|nr:response regulator transcription factor [Chloroflexota bacterium]
MEAAIKRLQSAANRFWEAAALIALGRALAELGDANGARATLRVALQVGTSMGRWPLLRGWPGVLPVVLPSLSEAWLAAMRSVVGSRADAVWSDGADLPTEEAIAEALGMHPDEDHPEPAAHRLTRREQEVVRLVAQGHTNREIAQALVISPGTARVHVERILSKLHLHSRIQLVVWAVGQHLSQTG